MARKAGLLQSCDISWEVYPWKRPLTRVGCNISLEVCPRERPLTCVSCDTIMKVYPRERALNCVGFGGLQTFSHMQDCGVEADVVTCCSLISALERGGQWHLAQQLFLDMCRTGAAAGSRQVSLAFCYLHLSLDFASRL